MGNRCSQQDSGNLLENMDGAFLHPKDIELKFGRHSLISTPAGFEPVRQHTVYLKIGRKGHRNPYHLILGKKKLKILAAKSGTVFATFSYHTIQSWGHDETKFSFSYLVKGEEGYLTVLSEDPKLIADSIFEVCIQLKRELDKKRYREDQIASEKK